MTIDEYAEFMHENGTKLRKVDGIWWKKVHPLFYRPLFPLLKISPEETKRPISTLLGGFQHLVPSYDNANSYMNFLLFDEVHEYSIEKLARDYRKNIKKGLRHFVIKKIDSINEFVTKGHHVYLSFCKRTNYKWENSRIHKKNFEKWVQTLFRFPKLLILGAYRNGDLHAISISCLVEETVIYGTLFSNTESLRLRTSELMLHVIREMAVKSEDISCIYVGLLGSKKGLDDFKISRGCKVLAEPAYLNINPLLHFLIKRLKKEDYKRLIGLDPKRIAKIVKGTSAR